MSSPSSDDPDFIPTIVLVHRATRALQNHMVGEANRRGHPEIKQAFNAVFATLDAAGSRTIDMADKAGITRQSMGEVVREMVRVGLLEMTTDPTDRRAKLVTYTEKGLARAREGYQHILELEQRFVEQFGSDAYEQTRDVLARLTEFVEGLADPPVDP